MSSKSQTLFTCLFFILAGGLIITSAVLFMLSSQGGNSNGNNSNSSSSSSSTSRDINKIPIEETDSTDYKYAAIMQDDVIKIFFSTEEEVAINISKNSWKDLKWSSDGKLLSVLGVTTTKEVFDLYLFDFDKKNWVNVTEDFVKDTGVESYLWLDENTTFFVYGKDLERWLHRVRFDAKEEFLKVVRTNGNIWTFSQDLKNIILYQPETKEWTGFLVNGTNEWKVNEVIDDNQRQIVDIKNILFVKDSDKVGIIGKDSVTAEDKVFLTFFQSNSAESQTLDSDFNVICSNTADELTGYTTDQQTRLATIKRYNIEDEMLSEVTKFSIPQGFSLEKFSCVSENEFLIKYSNGTDIRWSVVSSDGKIDKLDFLDNAKEVIVNSGWKDTEDN